DLAHRLERVLEHDEVTRLHEPELKWTDLGVKLHWRVEVTQPYVVPRLREKLAEENWQLTAADIVFDRRFFLDADLGTHLSIEGEVLYAGKGAPEQYQAAVGGAGGEGGTGDGESGEGEEVDELALAQMIRQHGGAGIYPVDFVIAAKLSDCKTCEPFQAPYVVFSFDLETSIATNAILCAAACVENWASGEQETRTFVGEEEQILADLTEFVRSSDPDIITGYNIDNFDLPRIAERTEALGGRGRWRRRAELSGWGRVPRTESEIKRNRDSVVPKRGNTRVWNLAGRCVMDTWWQARMSLRPKRETLKFVAGMLFPEREELQKMDIDASKMDEEWASRPDEVVKYCARDAELPLAILRAIQAVRRKEALGVVAKVSFDTAANGSTSQLLDSLVIRVADKRNIAVPMTNRVTSDSRITGGYVHDVEAGLHPWIAVLDFKSMYPSIMIKNNICYTTRIDDHHPDQPKEGEEIHTSPTGAKFRSADYTKGMIPHLLEDLMARRDLHKTALAVAKTEGDDKEIAFHDAMQFAVKIMMNSFYGVFASTFYRFTHIDLGSSITAWARHNIKAIIQGLEKEGIKVVYSDTDSIFVKAGLVTNPTKPPSMADPQGQSTSIVKGGKEGKGGEDEMDEDDKESAPTGPLVTTPEMDEWKRARNDLILFGEGLAKRFTADGAVLEFEKGLSVFFSHGAKKRYVGRVVYPAEEIIIRGYETQRTDSFDALTGGMQGIFDDVLDGEHDNAVKAAMEHIVAAKRNQIPIEQLVISKTCKGKVDKKGNVDFSHHYANPDGQASVQAARKRIERNLPFTPGMKVAFVVTNARNRPMQVEPWDEGQENGGISAYDGEFYAERLATAFGRVTEAFNWSAKELLAGNRQANLFSF
ncbi:MAG TPA: hypothetical protein EYN88_01390, partial [Candidatus Poseidoniales archaeon]|nr:hypothetical protein [Candidatus Poseidoniales archaeon]